MHIEEHRWWSNHLNRDMALKIYGHWGKPFIVFPSSRGRYFDYEGMGMIEAVAGFINSPLSYLSGMDDPWYLDLYRRSKIIVCVGQGAWEDEAIEDTRYLDFLFREKSVPAWIDYWGHDVNHDWPWWYQQMNHFLGYLYN